METRKLKILAIDDNADNLTVLKAVVREVLPGTEVITALNGRKGIELARTEDPDVILLDIVMPDLDGFEVCRIMKRDKRLQMIPVLFLTVIKTDRAIRVRAIEAGAEAFLSKPIDETELMAQVQAMAKIKAGNVSQRQKQERLETQVKASEERYMSIFDQSPFGIAAVDSLTRRFKNINSKFAEIMGRRIEEMPNIDWLSVTHPDDIQQNLDYLTLFNAGEIDGYSMDKRFIRPDGSLVWANITVTRLKVEDSSPTHLCMAIDITEKKEREQKIEYISYHDVLTGLYNRAFFEEEIGRLDSEPNLPLSTITGDINGLKLINDTLGHEEGDRLLVEMAKILKECCRNEDIIARVGGDEFSILLPRTSSEEARAIIDHIYAKCKEYKDKTDKDTNFLSISLGCATKTATSEPFSSISKMAEDHMYRRKLLEQKSFHSSLISSMRTTLFEKSHETEEHAARLVDLSKSLGRVLGLREEQLSELELLSTLHDIGKISIDDQILTKPDKLVDKEWQEIRKHPAIGYRIAMASPELQSVADYILCHHERWDGKGYPQGLSGRDIPVLSRILTVVDAYDAMTEDRPYRKAMPVKQAVIEIENNSGSQFDPEIADLFVAMIRAVNRQDCADQ